MARVRVRLRVKVRARPKARSRSMPRTSFIVSVRACSRVWLEFP